MPLRSTCNQDVKRAKELAKYVRMAQSVTIYLLLFGEISFSFGTY